MSRSALCRLGRATGLQRFTERQGRPSVIIPMAGLGDLPGPVAERVVSTGSSHRAKKITRWAPLCCELLFGQEKLGAPWVEERIKRAGAPINARNMLSEFRSGIVMSYNHLNDCLDRA